MIVVAGGTGILGSAIVRRLREDRRDVRVLTRERSRADGLAALGAEVAVGRLEDRASLESVFARLGEASQRGGSWIGAF